LKAQAALIILLAVALSDCATGGPTATELALCPASESSFQGLVATCEVHQDLTWAASMDPARSVQAAIARQDFRAIGIYGFALDTPGIPEPKLCWRESLGIRPIEGTTDAIQCKQQEQLQIQADVNACLYNRALLRYLLSHTIDPRVRRLTRRCS
jgi:hypothetical protein